MPEDNVWLTTVVPVVGGIVAMALFGSPVKAVLDARRAGSVGEFNPLPLIFIVANCVSWISYSLVTHDWYLFVPNTLGYLIGLFLFLTTYGIGIPDLKQRDFLVTVSLFLGAIIPVLVGLERLVITSEEAKKQLWGYASNAILFCFYTSPLSTISKVLRLRDASSLTLPLCIMNVGNGTLWLVYGLARQDAFVWVPNGVGAILGAVQTALCLLFRKKPPLGKKGSDVALHAEASSAAPDTSSSEVAASGPDQIGISLV